MLDHQIADAQARRRDRLELLVQQHVTTATDCTMKAKEEGISVADRRVAQRRALQAMRTAEAFALDLERLDRIERDT